MRTAVLPVRVLLVFTLVIWSSAWCCCAVRGAAVRDFAEDPAAAACCSRTGNQEHRACQLGGAAPEDESDSCCADPSVEERSDDEEPSGLCGDSSDPDCRCADRPNEQKRLDTSGKITGPKPVQDLAPVALHAKFRETAVAGHVVVLGSPDGGLASHVTSTLFQQGCLLLI